MDYFDKKSLQFLASSAGKKYCDRLGAVTGKILSSAAIEIERATGIPSATALSYLAPATTHLVFALSNIPKDDKELQEAFEKTVTDNLVSLLDNETFKLGS